MNRSRFIERDFASEGSDRSHGLALALSQIADPELLEALVHHVGALHEFGGEVVIVAMRDRFASDGERLVKVSEGGTFLTYGHVVGYNKKPRVKGQSVEPDTPYESQTAPELTSEEPASPVENGAEPEPVAAGE